MNNALTLLKPSEAEIVEKKSRFIAEAAPVTDERAAQEFIESVRKKNRDARHVCYAYYLGGGRTVRCSDDGEPSGTAGLPILDLIKKRGLNDVVITVTRYFGGILLGAPGLVRAYSASAKAALDGGELAEYCEVKKFVVSCEYKDFDKLRYMLESFGAYGIEPGFAEKVDVTFVCDSCLATDIQRKLLETFSGRIELIDLGVSNELRPIK